MPEPIMGWVTATATDSYRPNSEDRAAVFPTAFGLLAVVTDGVGGRTGGAAAADAVVRAVEQLAAVMTTVPGPGELATWLSRLDREVPTGETTVVVAALAPSGVTGVAVGDSVAWAIGPDGVADLAPHAGAKPWIGSGVARPVPFARPGTAGTVLLATDGLVKYTSREVIREAVSAASFDEVPRRLIDLVRPPSGRLPDDVAVIAVRFV
jgi:serine/threonine protein phosphatase PrpC